METQLGTKKYFLTCGYGQTSFTKTITLTSNGFIGYGSGYGNNVVSFSLQSTFGIDVQNGTAVSVSIVDSSNATLYAFIPEGIITKELMPSGIGMPPHYAYNLRAPITPTEQANLEKGYDQGVLFKAIIRVGNTEVGGVNKIDFPY